MKKILYELRYGASITYALIFINITVWIIANIISLLYNENYASLLAGGGYLPSIYSQHEYWRVLTANFLQISFFHMLFNVVSLFYYGRFIENFYTGGKLLIVYTICGIAGTLFSIFFYPDGVTLGASAAIWGFIGVMVGNHIRSNTYSPGLPIDMERMLPSIAAWMFVGFVIPGISGWGHVGGFLAGIVLGILLDNVNTFRPNENQEKIVKVGFFLCIGLIVISFAFMLYDLIKFFSIFA